MKRFAPPLVLLFLAGCHQQAAAPRMEARTIENAPVLVVPIEPPPIIDEEVQPLTPKNASEQELKRIEALGNQVYLPFAPAIAMDPVDGSKVSIRANTPMVDHKNHIYYFSSAENRAQFTANPDQYTKGALAKYQ